MCGVVECHGDGILGVSFLQNWLPDDMLVEPTTACLMQKKFEFSTRRKCMMPSPDVLRISQIQIPFKKYEQTDITLNDHLDLIANGDDDGCILRTKPVPTSLGVDMELRSATWEMQAQITRAAPAPHQHP